MDPDDSNVPLTVNEGYLLDSAEKAEEKPHLDHDAGEEGNVASMNQQDDFIPDINLLLDLSTPSDQSVLDDTETETFPDALYKSVKTLLSKDEYEQARILCEENISKLIKPSGTKLDNLILSNAFDSLALVYSTTNEFDKAIQMLSKVLELRQKELGYDHLSVATTLNNMAIYHDKLGKYLDAQKLCERSLIIKLKHLGNRHLQVGKSCYNLAIFYQKEDKHYLTEQYYGKALRIFNLRLDDDDPTVTKANFNLAACYRSKGKVESANALYRKRK